MKQILLLAVLLVTCSQLFAFTTQGVWRWRNDDGDEKTATWRAPENTPIMISSVDSVLRLRIEMYNNGSGGFLDGVLFEDSSDEAGARWDTIKLQANTNAFVLAGTSPNVTDLEPTTAQLGGQIYPFVPGKVIVATERLPAQTLPTGRRTEFEYVFKPSANIKPGVTYYFRLDAANYLVGYTLPSLTTAATLPVNITSFKVQSEQNRVLLQWTTASETGNDRFEVERSSNGRNWSVINSTKGQGTTAQAHTYSVYDNSPLNGTNFYRIKQYDVNGKMSVTSIKSLKILGERTTAVSVFPNPVKGNNIHFSLQQFSGGNLVATLLGAGGNAVHTQVFQAAQQGRTYRLQVPGALQSGMYILQIKGDGISENVKVMVQ